MSSLATFLHDAARKCRFWSRSTYDLTTAGELRRMSEELDDKAVSCRDVDCDDNKSPRLTERVMD
jgi:hypothetical protein